MHASRNVASGLIALLSLGSVTGCFIGSGDAASDSGAVEYGFTLSRGCANLFGPACPASTPLMTGIAESLRVRVPRSRDPQANLTVVSVTPDVLQVDDASHTVGSAQVDYQASIHTLRAGEATIVVQQPNGTVVDRVRVTVRDPTGMSVVNEEPTQSTLSADGAMLTVRVGQQASITGRVTAQGVSLLANDGVVWTVDDVAVAELSFGLTQGARIADDHVYVLPHRAGVSRLTATAGSQQRTITLTVTP